MDIVVCIKRVVATDSAIKIGPDGKSIDPGGVEFVLNPYDEFALEEALKEYGGGKVRTVEEPQYAGSNGAHKIALDMPEEYWREFDTTDEISASASTEADQTAKAAT